jgi:hypothetical protein
MDPVRLVGIHICVLKIRKRQKLFYIDVNLKESLTGWI